ncbi:hypothetical protein BN946_scf185001.g8 [Trametes cinnabarina]|uniref:Autophagy-related protein 27 n=1 Tax=Pycnoporus cinnabarinus TaxID=5643 RepID=A0A060SK31_PYCCI|nr:hypothetical protein BN946_scf185001.g8 [Trametes cinnabarina]
MLLSLALAFSLVLLCGSFAVVAAAADDGNTQYHKFRRLNDLTKQCRFVLAGQIFDLCPILEGNDGGWLLENEQRTWPTVTRNEYKISLRGPLDKDDDAPQHEQEITICAVSNRRPFHKDEDPRVLQVIPVAGVMNLPNITSYRPGVNITAQLAPPSKDDKHDVLHIRLHGGWYTYGAQKADIRFLCDHNVDEPSSPTIAWSWNGTHTFNWRSKHACSKRFSGTTTASPVPRPTSGTPADSSPEPVEDDAPPADSEPPTEDDPNDLRDTYPISDRASRAKLALLLSSFTAVVVLMYLAWFPPARVRQYVTRFLKAHPRLARFRVGERVLVRWAYEDLELGDDYAEGEEDVMVNFAPEADPEGIPLKPSPRLGGFSGYGTT